MGFKLKRNEEKGTVIQHKRTDMISQPTKQANAECTNFLLFQNKRMNINIIKCLD